MCVCVYIYITIYLKLTQHCKLLYFNNIICVYMYISHLLYPC